MLLAYVLAAFVASSSSAVVGTRAASRLDGGDSRFAVAAYAAMACGAGAVALAAASAQGYVSFHVVEGWVTRGLPWKPRYFSDYLVLGGWVGFFLMHCALGWHFVSGGLKSLLALMRGNVWRSFG